MERADPIRVHGKKRWVCFRVIRDFGESGASARLARIWVVLSLPALHALKLRLQNQGASVSESVRFLLQRIISSFF